MRRSRTDTRNVQRTGHSRPSPVARSRTFPPRQLGSVLPTTRGDIVAHDRKFRFGVQCATAQNGTEWAELARKAEDLGLLEPLPARPLRRPARTPAGHDGGSRRHDRPAHRRAGLRQRLQAPGRARQGDRHRRCPVGGPCRVRHRCGLDEHRLRAVGHPARPRRRADRPHGRGHRDLQGSVRRRRVRLRRRALPDLGDGRAPQARPEAPPASAHRWRRQAGAVDRRTRGRHRRHQPGREVGQRRRRQRPATDRPHRPTRSCSGSRTPPATATTTSSSTCWCSR